MAQPCCHWAYGNGGQVLPKCAGPLQEGVGQTLSSHIFRLTLEGEDRLNCPELYHLLPLPFLRKEIQKGLDKWDGAKGVWTPLEEKKEYCFYVPINIMEQNNTIYNPCTVIDDRITTVWQEIGYECHKLLEKESVICPWVIGLVFWGEVEAELAFEGLDDLSNHRGSREIFLSYSQQQYIPNKYQV